MQLVRQLNQRILFILFHSYRKTAMESAVDNDDDDDELGRDRAEIVSDHDSDEIDYPDERGENGDDN